MEIPDYCEKHGVNFYDVFNDAYNASFDEHEEHEDACNEGILAVLIATGPAPKEEEMEPIERIALAMEQQTESYLRNSDLYCMWLTRQLLPKDRVLERRALARDAYMAALGGQCAKGELSVTMTAEGAAILAIETVRRWDSFLAAVDAEGGE